MSQGDAQKPNEAIALLREIRDLMRMMVERLPAPPPRVADVEELDDKNGDQPMRFNPRGMTGIKGRRFSELDIETLGKLAKMFDAFAESNDRKGEVDDRGNPKSKWDRRSAALARGWAERKRAGWRHPDDLSDDPPPPPPDDFDPPPQSPPTNDFD